jgi:uncharacterized membrane protein
MVPGSLWLPAAAQMLVSASVVAHDHGNFLHNFLQKWMKFWLDFEIFGIKISLG